jgi:hypothetical protein
MAINPAQPASNPPPGGYGKLFLHDPELPALACTLIELKPEKCRGFVPLLELNPETVLAWQQKLMPREKLRLRLEFMRGLPGLELEGLVHSVTSIDSGVEIELGLVPSGSARHAILSQTASSTEQEPESLEPVQAPTMRNSSVITLTPLSAEEIAAMQQEMPQPASESVHSDNTPQIEQPKDPYLAMDHPAGRATVDTRGAMNESERPPSIAFDARDVTVAFERPANLRQPSTKAAPSEKQSDTTAAPPPTPTVPPAPSPDATVGIERPAELKKAAPILAPGSTEDIPRFEADKAVAQGSVAPPQEPSKPGDAAPQTERRAAARESGQLTVSLGPAAAPGAPTSTKKLGEVLVQMGKLTPQQVEEVLRLSLESGQRIGRCLLAWELVPPDVLCRALSIQSGLPMTVLEGETIPERLNKIFPLPMMMRHSFVPFDESSAVLCVAACNPLDTETQKELERISHKVVEVFLAREDHVARQLDWMRVKMKTRSRRSLRYKMSLSVVYQFCSRLGARTDKEVYQGTSVNLSEGGLLVESPQAPGDPGEMLLNGLYVNICLKPAIGEIWAICDVREIRLVPDSAPPRWLLGLEIVDINEESRARLQDLFRTAKSTRMVKA